MPIALPILQLSGQKDGLFTVRSKTCNRKIQFHFAIAVLHNPVPLLEPHSWKEDLHKVPLHYDHVCFFGYDRCRGQLSAQALHEDLQVSIKLDLEQVLLTAECVQHLHEWWMIDRSVQPKVIHEWLTTIVHGSFLLDELEYILAPCCIHSPWITGHSGESLYRIAPQLAMIQCPC